MTSPSTPVEGTEPFSDEELSRLLFDPVYQGTMIKRYHATIDHLKAQMVYDPKPAYEAALVAVMAYNASVVESLQRRLAKANLEIEKLQRKVTNRG